MRLLIEGTIWHSWSPDQHKIAFGWTGKVRLYSFPEGQEIAVFETGENAIYSMSWSPDGTYIVMTGNIPGQMDSALFVAKSDPILSLPFSTPDVSDPD